MHTGPTEASLATLQRRVLERMVAAGDGRGRAVDGDPLAVTDATWERLVQWATADRVIGALAHAALRDLALTDAQLIALRRRQLASCQATMSVDASLPPVAAALDAAGIEFAVLKGVATARLLYPDVTMRHYVDIDLLIRYEVLPDAVRALAPLTAQSAPAQAGPAREWAVKEHALLDRRGVEVDVHYGVQGSLLSSRLDTDLLLQRRQPLDVDGVAVHALSDAGLLVHAVLHMSSANWKMSGIPDVVLLCRRVSPTDAEVQQLIERPAVRRLLVWALLRVSEWAELPADWQQFMDAHPLGRRASWYGWVHEREERIRLANALLGPRRLRRVAETAWPRQSFLDELGITRRGNIARIAGAGRAAARPR